MSDTHTIAPSADLPAAYQPTPPEQAVLARHRARKAAHPPSPRVRLARRDGALRLEPEHPKRAVGRALLMEALGTLDPNFLDGLLQQLSGVDIQGIAPDEVGLNFMMAMVTGIKPRDQIETMLAAQMAAAHMITMSISRPLQAGKPWRERDIIASFAKLSRTFMAQVETLKRYRSVERQVTVEQVTVNDGGQAIVGQVEMNSGGAGPLDAAVRAEESSPPTPWTEDAPQVPHEAAAAAPQFSPPTPWTGTKPAAVPDHAEIASPEISPPTPWTGAEAPPPPGDAQASGPENSPPTPWTGGAAPPSGLPPSGLPPRPRRPGAYLQVLRENLAAIP